MTSLWRLPEGWGTAQHKMQTRRFWAQTSNPMWLAARSTDSTAGNAGPGPQRRCRDACIQTSALATPPILEEGHRPVETRKVKATELSLLLTQGTGRRDTKENLQITSSGTSLLTCFPYAAMICFSALFYSLKVVWPQTQVPNWEMMCKVSTPQAHWRALNVVPFLLFTLG